MEQSLSLKPTDSTQTTITMISCIHILKAHNNVTKIMNVVNVCILLCACVNITLMIVSTKDDKVITNIYFKTYSCLINILVFAWNVVVIKLIRPATIYQAKIETLSPANSIYGTTRESQLLANSSENLMRSASLSTLESSMQHNGAMIEVLPRPQSTPV